MRNASLLRGSRSFVSPPLPGTRSVSRQVYLRLHFFTQSHPNTACPYQHPPFRPSLLCVRARNCSVRIRSSLCPSLIESFSSLSLIADVHFSPVASAPILSPRNSHSFCLPAPLVSELEPERAQCGRKTRLDVTYATAHFPLGATRRRCVLCVSLHWLLFASGGCKISRPMVQEGGAW